MDDPWIKDLTKSNALFVNAVWPVLEPLLAASLGRGKLMPVEILQHNTMAIELDKECGMDFLYRVEGRGVVGIASRVQSGEKYWGTFTVRKSRPSGARTEYVKRREALDSGEFLTPGLTCQAYCDNNGNLLGGGIASTRDVVDAVDDNCTNWNGGVEFFVVHFERVARITTFP